MLTFSQFLDESVGPGLQKGAAAAIALKISSLNGRLQQDRTATGPEKLLGSQLTLLAALVGVVAWSAADAQLKCRK